MSKEDFLKQIRVDIGSHRHVAQPSGQPKKGGDTSDDPYKEEKQRSRPDNIREKRTEKKRENVRTSSERSAGFSSSVLSGGRADELIEHLLILESKYLGITAPSYSHYYDDGSEASSGQYSATEGKVLLSDGSVMHVEKDTIYLNDAFFPHTGEEYRDFFDTIIHELRHKYQSTVGKIHHPEISPIAKEYLNYSDDKYEDDSSTLSCYQDNGLETDARAYAAARAELYLTYSVEQILQMDSPPKSIVHNQILMGAGDQSVNGRIAPVTVSGTFESTEFKRWRAGKSENNTHYKRQDERGNSSMYQGTDFSESAQHQAAELYGQVIDNIQSFSEKVLQHFEERIKGHPYRQLKEAGNVFITYYNEKLPNEIKDAIRTWIQSDNSFRANLRDQYEGDESASVNAAYKTEEGLIEKVNSCFKNINLIQHEYPISVDKDLILTDAQYMESAGKELSALKEKWMDIFERLGEQQNSLYATMMPMVADTFTNVESGYQATKKDIEKISEEFTTGRTKVTGRDSGRGREKEKTIIDRSDIFHGMRKRRY